LDESAAFLRLFRIGEIGIETALHYARIIAKLRGDASLVGRSKPDLWIAAWAVEHGSTRYTKSASLRRHPRARSHPLLNETSGETPAAPRVSTIVATPELRQSWRNRARHRP
jgi:predicted nucleic acid-binding protein